MLAVGEMLDQSGSDDDRKGCGLELLYDSKGRHVATLMERYIHGVDGACIGYYHTRHGVFVDLDGRYLGEIVYGDRLMYNLLSVHCTATFEARPHRRRIEVVADPGCREPIVRISRYVDIDPKRLTGVPDTAGDVAYPLTGLTLLMWAGRYTNPESFDLLMPYL